MKKIITETWELITSANTIEYKNKISITEIAFLGKSNVGKSSIINSLIGKKITQTSKTPGRTQKLFFFKIKKNLLLVDLPGYGYSKNSKLFMLKNNKLILDYIKRTHKLKYIYLLIDSRRQLCEKDANIIKVLIKEKNKHQIILTKIDKVKKEKIGIFKNTIKKTINKNPYTNEEILATSSKTKQGINKLRKNIFFTKKSNHLKNEKIKIK